MTARGQGRDVRGQDGKEVSMKRKKCIMKEEKERGGRAGRMGTCGEGRGIRKGRGHRERKRPGGKGGSKE